MIKQKHDQIEGRLEVLRQVMDPLNLVEAQWIIETVS